MLPVCVSLQKRKGTWKGMRLEPALAEFDIETDGKPQRGFSDSMRNAGFYSNIHLHPLQHVIFTLLTGDLQFRFAQVGTIQE